MNPIEWLAAATMVLSAFVLGKKRELPAIWIALLAILFTLWGKR